MGKSEEEIFRAWVGLVRSHQVVMNAVEGELKKAGLPPLTWYDLLLELNREERRSLRLQEIGERILLAKNNVTRLVDRLEQEQLVTRERCKKDGRGIYARITEAGQRLLRNMWPTYRNAIMTHFSKQLRDQDIESLLKLAERLQPSHAIPIQKSVHRRKHGEK